MLCFVSLVLALKFLVSTKESGNQTKEIESMKMKVS